VQARGGLRSGSRRRPVSALWLEWLQSILHWRHIYLTQVLLKIRSPALPLLVLLFYVISFFACSQILKVLVGRKSPSTNCCCYYQTSSPHLLRSRHDKDTKHLFTNAPEDQNDARNSQESPSKNRKFFTESTGKIEGERRKRRVQAWEIASNARKESKWKRILGSDWQSTAAHNQ
jgi:hypothetical protein